MFEDIHSLVGYVHLQTDRNWSNLYASSFAGFMRYLKLSLYGTAFYFIVTGKDIYIENFPSDILDELD